MRHENIDETDSNNQYPINIPPPVYPSLPYPCFCGCNMAQEAGRKIDCFFYGEERDMGASIPYCSYRSAGLDDCPCEGCAKYISKAEAYKLIVEKMSRPDK